MKKYKFTYEKSGVNINAADSFVKYIANLNKKKNQITKITILEVLPQLQVFQEVLKNLYWCPALMVWEQKLK